MRLCRTLAALLGLLALQAQAVGCPESALGTARVVQLPHEASAYGGTGAALPLAPGEVVLTFDDGPRPESTPAVLQALQAECVRATFFMVGEPMRLHPELAREVRARGHSIGLHGYRHPSYPSLTEADQFADLREVEAAHHEVFGGSAPAFRFPFIAESAFMRGALAAQRFTVMAVDVGVEDWEPQSTAQMVDKLVQRLAARRGGIVLLHDAQDRTAAALPQMLRALKTNGYRVVHLEWR